MAVGEGVTSYFPKENVASTLNERCGVTRVCGQLAIIHKEILSTLSHLVWIDMEEPSSGVVESGECIHRERTCISSLRRGPDRCELTSQLTAFHHSLKVN